MHRSGAVTLLLTLAAPFADSGSLDRLPKDGAGEVVRRAIEYAGGIDAWEGVRALEFRKTTIRFRPDRSEERRRVELHRYRLRPFAVRIEWTEGGKSFVLVNDGRQAWKLVDGQAATSVDDRNQARNATFGSHYVFNMPFKLTDPGVHLEHTGKRALPNGKAAEAIRVTYDKGAGDAGGLHTWVYLFDPGSGRLVANHLTYDASKYDYTEYLDDRAVGPLRLSTRRYGYDADARGKKGPKRSEIVYEGIRVDPPLDDGIFVGPK